MKDLKISLIGSGRVATQLATAFYAAHVQIQQVLSRNIHHAARLAQQVNAIAIDDVTQLALVDILIIAVSDAEIIHVAEQLRQLNYQGCVVHTSGSTDITSLADKNLRAGVFYPLQTFSFEHQVNWSNVPIFLEAVQPQDIQVLEYLAQLLTAKIYHYSSQQRLALHLAAVFACNFSNYCYDIAQQILQSQHVDTGLLQPLIMETASKLEFFSAVHNQTGPAKRHDHNILTLHQQMLADSPKWQNIYQVMSDGIQRRHTWTA
mgnify:CR=1 FL=1|jgi:predicted short-subunit dehydrogenase-like oxidoreductase (DUF2520 family)